MRLALCISLAAASGLVPAQGKAGPEGATTPPGAALAREALPVQSVAKVDLGRYIGKWYEIAAFPMFFQRQCIGDTTAEYARRPDGDISVTNRCRTEQGFDEATAKAWPVEGTGNAQLKVSFFWPFRADYWVIGLDEEYRWAVVGNPDRKYLWILSRTPRLGDQELRDAVQAAVSQGFDVSQLRHTVHGQSPGAQSRPGS
jgi:apolipoprotein D and lipocalin family protein